MMSLTSSSSIWRKLAAVFIFPVNAIAEDPVPEYSEDNRKAEQDVINEMIWSNPSAMSSELSAYYLMHMCSGRR